MKVTIYNRNGTTEGAVPCQAVEPYCGDEWKMVVFERAVNTGTYSTEISRYLITNLSFILEGSKQGREPDETDTPMCILLLDDEGGHVRMWEGAKGVSFLKGLVTFKAEGEWFTICGPVMIEPQIRK